ncbi:BfmA/BtgA family mobilization protein [Mariniflexile sp. AS56]|uniref:BfmA/BtgA family mobilization protein n=1 Tax=Mariniflexile sp. AS56 TaxID=3063957 RepID=UPI0026F3559F|nr:BfmA/BtgA family mobilization protein [Mariniflexile sp. AS56]MDO7171759.1 BfmA/BtgA family mobilization protein [Mariniflexile sp. AS56]
MDDFNTIRLKKKTIVKFKKYSKKTSPSYSETIDFMIAFFEDNNLSPYDTLGMNRTSLQNVLNKRIDAVITILRQVEETQLKPTKKMLESLFEEVEDTKPLILEKSTINKPILTAENEALTYYRNAYFKQQAELNGLKHKLKDTIGEFKLIKNTFSSNFYVLKLSEHEYSVLKDSTA